MLVALIVACELAFWAVLIAGLIVRYPLGRPRLGAILLAVTPLIDVVLLAAAVVDLRRGGEAAMRHALAAIYLGCSIAFGSRIIAWADGQFAHRFAGSPKPSRSPRFGADHARAERNGWYRHLLAWAIAAVVLGFMHVIGGNRDETQTLFGVLGPWAIVVAIDFVWSFSSTFFPRRPPDPAESSPTAHDVQRRHEHGRGS